MHSSGVLNQTRVLCQSQTSEHNIEMLDRGKSQIRINTYKIQWKTPSKPFFNQQYSSPPCLMCACINVPRPCYGLWPRGQILSTAAHTHLFFLSLLPYGGGGG